MKLIQLVALESHLDHYQSACNINSYGDSMKVFRRLGKDEL